MNRFATRYWLQDRPLSVQLWACLSLAEGLTLAAILLYVLLLLRPEEPGQWYGLAALFPLLLIANLFAAKLAARRITEPLERLAGNLERIKGKNWSEPVLQVAAGTRSGRLSTPCHRFSAMWWSSTRTRSFSTRVCPMGSRPPLWSSRTAAPPIRTASTAPRPSTSS